MTSVPRSLTLKARIHRGADEIGGSCVELEADGRRLVLDAGLPLDETEASVARLPPSAEQGDERLVGVVISHAHPDHYGLWDRVHERVPIYMGRDASEVLRASSLYTGREAPRVDGMLGDRGPKRLGPFTIIPLLVDHSAFDAYAFLVEGSGRRLLYSGDLRAHGRKRGAFLSLVESPPGRVDTLLMEGTTVSRRGLAGVANEGEVEDLCAELFGAAEGAALAFFSPQNVDRLVTVFRAARQAGRTLVMDLYAADVAAATHRVSIPQAEWSGVRVYVPNHQRYQVRHAGEFERVERIGRSRVFAEELAADPSRWVIGSRVSMLPELEKGGVLNGAQATWLMWPGYLRKPGDETRAKLERLGIPLVIAHASGHATVPDLQRLVSATRPGKVVPIHTADPERFRELFADVELQPNRQWWNV